VRRAAALALAAAALAGAARAQGENRCWLGEVELAGPLTRVELDCGADGRTLLAGALVAGERRRVTVPLPLAPPLGLAGLAAVAPPAIEAAGGGSARWAGFAREQPEHGWLELPPALRVRPRPPAGAGTAPLALPAVLVAALAAAAAAVLGARRRALAALAACAGAAVAAALAGRQAPPGERTALLEGDLAARTAVRVLAAPGALDLRVGGPLLRLEAAPGSALELEVDLATGAARARAAPGLVSFEAEPAFEAEAAALVLRPAWFRSAAGVWTRYASVAGGRGRAEPGEDPPGWLRAGLPPGRTVLLGVDEGRGFVRLTGGPAVVEGD
jgi:hypothetical protein